MERFTAFIILKLLTILWRRNVKADWKDFFKSQPNVYATTWTPKPNTDVVCWLEYVLFVNHFTELFSFEGGIINDISFTENTC